MRVVRERVWEQRKTTEDKRNRGGSSWGYNREGRDSFAEAIMPQLHDQSRAPTRGSNLTSAMLRIHEA